MIAFHKYLYWNVRKAPKRQERRITLLVLSTIHYPRRNGGDIFFADNFTILRKFGVKDIDKIQNM